MCDPGVWCLFLISVFFHKGYKKKRYKLLSQFIYVNIFLQKKCVGGRHFKELTVGSRSLGHFENLDLKQKV